MSEFKFYKQLDQMDCGATCLRMIAKYYGKNYSGEFIRERCYINRQGGSILDIADAAESIGMHSLAVRVSFDKLQEQVTLPCIAHWKQRHFIVIYKIKRNKIHVADPAHGLITYTKEQFLKGWLHNKKNETEDEGLLLLIEPSPDFDLNIKDDKKRNLGFKFLFSYLKSYKSYIYQLIIGLSLTSIFQLAFPFLTQAIVDYGVSSQNLSFIYLILIAQLVLFLSQTTVNVVRSWLLLHLGARVNIAIISDFLTKLLRLPISFFESKMMGDLLQRIDDHKRVEQFLSSTTLNIAFSFFNLIIFGIVLCLYDIPIFLIFLFGTCLYILWVLFFIKKRALVEYMHFDQASQNRSSIIQLLTGIQEIKLNNSERKRRWQWEGIQTELFKISVKSLTLEQTQSIGATFLNELKNIIITFLAAKSVIDGSITLGMMLAIQYIIGQLNGPINNFISFIQTSQDAKISLERLSEVHSKEDEESAKGTRIDMISEKKCLHVKNLNFQYGSPNSPLILRNINIHIPENKVTAIVGASGSGKTTLLKLLLKLYNPTMGNIYIDKIELKNISSKVWRNKCGVVMQDGFIFSDSIANNIVESSSESFIDKEKLLYAVRVANLEEFIESLPLGYNTVIGWNGLPLSGGQKQRILIARAVYKDPDFLFFDEATSALDADNEKIIMENLSKFNKGRTVVVIAHRLSTVKNADQIIVLDKGEVIELGSHEGLTKVKGKYYTLVKNQLELGN